MSKKKVSKVSKSFKKVSKSFKKVSFYRNKYLEIFLLLYSI